MLLSVTLPAIIIWNISRQQSTASSFLLGIPLLIFLILIGRWDLGSYALRYTVLAAFLLVGAHKWGWGALVLTVFCLILPWLLLRRPAREQMIEAEFPLRGGTFYVVQGGATPWVNRHSVSRSQRYALDIVALNCIGARAKGIYPSRLSDYRIFGETVYSPCSGTITAAVDHLSDLSPAQMDTTNVAGNYIVIRFDDTDTYVGLAHLKQRSVTISKGDRVQVGQALACVGNSGHTSEPHLHIHAKRGGRADSMLDGEGIAMHFGGRWLIRNSVVRRVTPTASHSFP